MFLAAGGGGAAGALVAVPQKTGARGGVSVDRVALAEPLPGMRVGLVDLHDREPVREQCPYEAGRVGAGRLDADPLDMSMSAQPAEQAAVALGRGRERRRREQPT